MPMATRTSENQTQFRMSRWWVAILRLLVLNLSCRLCAARKEPGGRPAGVHAPTWKLCLLVVLPVVAAVALVVALIVCVCRWKKKDAPVEAVESAEKKVYNPKTRPHDNPMSINPTMVRSATTSPNLAWFAVSPPTAATTSPSHAPRRLRSPSLAQTRCSPLRPVPAPAQGRGKREEKAMVVKDPLACYSPAISMLLPELDYERLQLATNGFGKNSQPQHVRRGGLWHVVFKDTQLVEDQGLPANVVIKRYHRIFSDKECERIREELKCKFTLRHKHLVSLLGYSLGEGRLYMVYDRLSKGSLEKHLFPKSGSTSLDWTARQRIAKEVAQGLDPLHVSNLPHGSIRVSSIMLDHYFTAHLDDHFHYRPDMSSGGGARTSSSTTEINASLEADIADLGAVILELVCGRRCTDAIFFGNTTMPLVDWVWAIYGEAFTTEEPHKRDEIKENRIFDAVDLALEGDIDRSQASKLLILGLACSHPDPMLRPKIRDVREVLLDLKPVPLLPLSKPTCE